MDTNQLLNSLRAAGEPTRLRILALCAAGDLTVGELTTIIDQSQPSVSRHLKLLCDAQLLERYQEGTSAFFHIPARGEVATFVRFIIGSINTKDPKALRDRRKFNTIKAERAERADAYFRENAVAWDQIRSLHIDKKLVEAAVLSMFSDKQSGNLLDVGTGTGRMLQLLGHLFDEAIGVDKSRDMLSVARNSLSTEKYPNCSVRRGNMYQLPFPDRSFIAVVLHMVLHFSDEPLEAIAEAARVLQPTGNLYIVDFLPHTMEIFREQHAHRRLGFPNTEITNWCNSLGLKVVENQLLEGSPLTVAIWKMERPNEGEKGNTSKKLKNDQTQ